MQASEVRLKLALVLSVTNAILFARYQLCRGLCAELRTAAVVVAAVEVVDERCPPKPLSILAATVRGCMERIDPGE